MAAREVTKRSKGDGAAEPPKFPSVAESTERALAAANLSEVDDGAVATLRILARKIDTDAMLREAYLAWQIHQEVPADKLKHLQMDNVSVPTYLKFCESLGLTPAGRSRLKPQASAPPAAPAKGKGRARLRAL